MAKSPPTKAEKLHMAWVASLPCLVSGQRATVHHVTGFADRMGRFARSHRCVVPLAAEYHLIQHGPRMSVEALGHSGFFQEWGIDLLAQAQRLEAESIALGILPELGMAA